MTPVKKPAGMKELDINARTRNALIRSTRCMGERGFALLTPDLSPARLVTRYQVAFATFARRAGPTFQVLFGRAKRCNVDSPHSHSLCTASTQEYTAFTGSTQRSLVGARLAISAANEIRLA